VWRTPGALLAYKKPCNFLRAIRAIYPDVIHKHPLDMKQKFTPAQAAYRVAQCLAVKALLVVAPNLLLRTCFMDAYHVKIKPGRVKGFGVYCKMLWSVHYKLLQNGMSMASFQPWFSFDHNFAQEYADLSFTADMLPPGCEYVPGYDFTKVRVPLPKYSPDCHRVIEHIFGQLSFKLYREMYRRGSQLTSTQAIAQYVVQQFHSLTADSMQRDADGLPKLYDWIIENQGAWPPRKMR
jgi:hypothetical protein